MPRTGTASVTAGGNGRGRRPALRSPSSRAGEPPSGAPRLPGRSLASFLLAAPRPASSQPNGGNRTTRCLRAQRPLQLRRAPGDGSAPRPRPRPRGRAGGRRAVERALRSRPPSWRLRGSGGRALSPRPGLLTLLTPRPWPASACGGRAAEGSGALRFHRLKQVAATDV